MNRQVVTIGPDGSLSGLQRKPGQGLDLRQFGAAQIKRASEIEWQEGCQRWAVRFLSGPYNGQLLTAYIMDDAGLKYADLKADNMSSGEMTLFWSDYDDAVKAEIAVLDALRVAGQMEPA